MDQASFLFQAMVYMAAAVVMVPIAKKLGLGSVLGYLLAGILIGPAGFGFIGEEGQDIMHFAEFGVVMMLFLVGLELEPQLLWNMRKSILGMGGMQVLGTAMVVMVIAMSFGLNWKQAIAIGMTLSLSSTAIALQMLGEKGLLKTAGGQSSFSVLLFQDIAVIPMLAFFPLLSSGAVVETDPSHSQGFVQGLDGWMQTLFVFGAVIVIVLAGRFLVRPLLRVVAATKLREVFIATALLLIVGIAVLMTTVGLSPALGTFLAGVVLADSEYRHELQSDIDPFKGLLLGLFFIAVGASIDFNLILKEPLVILGLVLLLMLIKGAVLFTLGKLFKLTLHQNLIFAFALCQVGEFAFVLFSFSTRMAILDQGLVNILVAVVAISMALTPLFMLLNEKLILPFVGTKITEELPADTITEKNPVIIAGFGNFGNTVGRFLRAHKIGTTVLEIDSDRVNVLRRLGFKVYYGDATRYDLLEAAGAHEAKLIIIAIEPAEKRLEMIEMIKKHFPKLQMLVRSENRFDSYDLMNAGMLHVYRETLDTALRMGVDTMKMLGHRSYTAVRSARMFRRLDEQNLKRLASIKDKDEYILTARENIEELERILQLESQNLISVSDSGWDEETLIAEANKQPNKPTT